MHALPPEVRFQIDVCFNPALRMDVKRKVGQPGKLTRDKRIMSRADLNAQIRFGTGTS